MRVIKMLRRIFQNFEKTLRNRLGRVAASANTRLSIIASGNTPLDDATITKYNSTEGRGFAIETEAKSLRPAHKDTMFRGIFKIPENFVYLLQRCRGADAPISPDELTPFDLESEFAIRLLRNDVSFVTKDGRLIILIEHQSTLNPNMAFRLFLYYAELLQLWLKTTGTNLYGGRKIENFPVPEFYVVYNGTRELKNEVSTFTLHSESIKIDVAVKIVSIHYEELTAAEAGNTKNALAGYSFFYKIFDECIASGATKDAAFETSRLESIKKGYLPGYIEKERFIMEYKRIIFDYATQLRMEGLAEGEAKGEARGEAKGEARGKEETLLFALQSGIPFAQVKTIAAKAGVSESRLNELLEKSAV